MKGSGISSATTTPPGLKASPGTARPGSPTRRHFALDGRSVALDPLTHAVRPDLADVRLADRVFAPHYAAAVPRVTRVETVLRTARAAGSATLATLPAGAPFELLDILGDDAWGIAIRADRGGPLVGYVDAAVLGEP